MVTKTTDWSRKISGPYIRLSFDPTQNAPPWINTITGRSCPKPLLGKCGVNTFKYKQSSCPKTNFDSGLMTLTCMQVGDSFFPVKSVMCSSHVFTNSESTKKNHKIFFALFFYKVVLQLSVAMMSWVRVWVDCLLTEAEVFYDAN